MAAQRDETTPLRPVDDLAGTPVLDVEGEPAGTVYGALVEAATGVIRYLDVRTDGDRHVLVPIGHARLHGQGDACRVRLRAASRAELDEIPLFEPQDTRIESEYQEAVLAAHGRLFYGERYYAHPAYDHDGLYAGPHPIVRGETAPTSALPLARLSETPGLRTAPGQPDIRGQPLTTGDGERAGEILDLIIDPEAHRVRYALVGRPEARPTYLPVGFISIDPESGAVRAPALRKDDVAALPPAEWPFTRIAEERLRAILDQRLAGDRTYERPDFRTSTV